MLFIKESSNNTNYSNARELADVIASNVYGSNNTNYSNAREPSNVFSLSTNVQIIQITAMPENG